jgi:ribosomal protein S18 acetylase RimI-like enzyme
VVSLVIVKPAFRRGTAPARTLPVRIDNVKLPMLVHRGGSAMPEVTVRKATPADVSQLGGTLGRAFQDDPAVSWAVPNAERRARHLARYFELLTSRIYLPKDEVYLTEDGTAAALWTPPDRWEVSTMDSLPMLPIMVRACRGALPRAMRMLNLMDRKHREHDEPHYYLAFIGTDPASQGKGYGTAVISRMLERCDDEGVPAYLESSSIRNQALYYRHGFEVVEDLNWPGGGPPFSLMWRKPR